MVKGGYQIINLDGVEFRTGISMQCEGLYEKIEGTRKAILLSGLIIDGEEYHDMYIYPRVLPYEFSIDCEDYILVISNRDICTVYSKNINIGYDGLQADITGEPFSIGEDDAKSFKFASEHGTEYDFRVTINESGTNEVYYGKVVGRDDTDNNIIAVTNLGVLSMTIDGRIVTINKIN